MSATYTRIVHLLSTTRRFQGVICLLMLSAGLGCGASSGNGQPDSSNSTQAGQAVEPHYQLSEDHREYLWSLEHHNNILMQVGFKKLAAAIQSGMVENVRQELADSFQASTSAELQQSKLASSKDLQGHRDESAGTAKEQISAAEFAAELVRVRKQFGKEFRIGFGVTSIAPQDRADPTGLWSADFRMRQWGRTNSGELLEVITYVRATLHQPNKDKMAQGKWLVAWQRGTSSESKSARFLMKDVAQEVGIDVNSLHDNWRDIAKIQGTGGIYACDYNLDGCPDLLVTDIKGNKMYRGDPQGKFHDVTVEVGLVLTSNDVRPAFVDLNGDGWPDLVMADGTIFRNVDGREFRQQRKSNLSKLIQPGTIESSTTAITVADFDRDGRLDLYLTRNGTRPKSWLTESSNSLGNQLLRNLGDWQFEDVTESAGASGGKRSVFAAVWLDANNDRWPDVFIINEYGNGGLFINNRDKTFTEKNLIAGPGDFGSMGVTAGDIDNDGNIDIFLASMYSKAGSRVISNIPERVYPPQVMARLKRFVTGSELYLNKGKLSFAPQGRKFQIHDAGWAWGPALVDLNGDGWLDVFSTAGYMSRDRHKPDG